jgi:hypothetical protein
MDELWQQAFDDTPEGGTVSHRFADLLFAAQPAPTVQEPVATKLKTEQFNCFHVSAEDFKNLKALPVGTKLYTTQPTQPAPVQKPKFVYNTYVNHREVDKASVFDLNNPPIAHNPSLCKNTSCLYFTPEGEVFYWDHESEIYRHRSEPVQAEAIPPAAQPAPVQQERELLRTAQSEAVMPLIGPLLDAWEGGSDFLNEYPALDKQLRRIHRAMEHSQPAAQQEPINVAQAYAMAQVCLDLHDALGCKWGDNPYLTISQLKAAAPEDEQ